jgi:DNA-binding NtrC family response regulator
MTKKILIVADDAGQRRVMHGILEPMGTILEASTSKEALRLVAAEKPDLMMLDVVMTEMDGISIMRAAHFLDPALPIVMLAGEHIIETAKRALDNGSSAYIKKPFVPEEVREAVRRLFIRKSDVVPNRCQIS